MADIITVNLISGFLEFVLFGIFLILAPAALVLLVRRHRDAAGRRAGVPGMDSQSSGSVMAVGVRRTFALVMSSGATLWDLRRSPLVVANVLFLILNIAVSTTVSKCTLTYLNCFVFRFFAAFHFLGSAFDRGDCQDRRGSTDYRIPQRPWRTYTSRAPCYPSDQHVHWRCSDCTPSLRALSKWKLISLTSK